MISYGSFDYDTAEVRELTLYLQSCARKKIPVHYDDAFNVVKHFGGYHGPHDNRLWHLLGYISEEEVRQDRAALSAIVTLKESNMPGSGFFELERQLGRYAKDDETTWVTEINELFEYWPRH